MSTFACRKLILLSLVSIVLAIATPTFAGSGVATGGQPAIVGMTLKIVITPSLALQVKTGSADTMLASRPVIEGSDAVQTNADDKNIHVAVSANLTKHGVLNVSSNLLSAGNSPTSKRRVGQGRIESLTLPYLTTGRYQLVYTPNNPITPLSPDDSSTIILCSP